MIIRDHSQRIRAAADGVRFTGQDPVFTTRSNPQLIAQHAALWRMREDGDAAEVRVK